MSWDESPERRKLVELIFTEQKTILKNIKDKKEQNYKIAKFLLEETEILTTRDNNEMFIYCNGSYTPDGEQKIKELIQLILEEDATTSKVIEIINHIQRSSYMDRKEFYETPTNLICLQNGIFNLNTFQLEPHTPTMKFLSVIPINFNPLAKPPKKIIEFIRQIVPNERRRLVYEMIAYCLYRETTFQVSFMLVGSGRNGKSTLLNLINTAIGPDNSTQVEVQELTQNRFALANLFGKHLNFFADLPQTALKETGRFKAISSGDWLNCEEKFKKGFSFKPYAKLIFSANMVPRTDDDSDAFYRRWAIITFPNKFDGDIENRTILQELTSKEELEGLLIILLMTLKVMLKTNQISDYQTVEEKRKLYTKLSDPVGSFIMDKLEQSNDNYVIKQDLYNMFYDYCKKNQYPIVSMKMFAIVLQKTMKLEDYRALIVGERIHCWRGIRFIYDDGEKNINKADYGGVEVNHNYINNLT